MKKLVSIMLTLALAASFALAVPVMAEDDPPNTVASSTMIFQGSLDYNSETGAYTGTIDMVNENNANLGDQIAGFDVYAKWGGCAYIEGYYGDGDWNCAGTDTLRIGSDYDAYPPELAGRPWGDWYDPDCADWDQYELELTADHWYLRYKATDESPMSGVMDWDVKYAAETDPGTVKAIHGGNTTDPTEYSAGSAQEWGWHCGWGEERIPLQYPGFDVSVTGGSDYIVTLTPAEAGSTLLIANVPDITAISVLPTSIDFGTLRPGDTSAIFNIDVQNIGTRTVNVDVDVVEAGLFYDNLEMTNNGSPPWSKRPWDNLVAGLLMDATDDVQTKLTVPGTYTGSESATLLFTAEAV